MLALLADPDEWLGKDVRVCNAIATMREYAAAIQEVAELDIRVHELTLDDGCWVAAQVRRWINASNAGPRNAP